MVWVSGNSSGIASQISFVSTKEYYPFIGGGFEYYRSRNLFAQDFLEIQFDE
jgi:hypothetical protein